MEKQKQTLTEFVDSLQMQGLNVNSVTAAQIFTGAAPLMDAELSTKVQLHDKLLELGLKQDSPLFNRAWVEYHPKLKLR